MKQLFTLLLCTSLSTMYAAAAKPEENPPPNTCICVTNPRHTIDVVFNSLVLQPTTSDLHYAAEAIPLPAPSPHWEIYNIDPSYNYGFDIAFKRTCPVSLTFVKADWEHFHSTDSANTTLRPSDMIGPFFEIGPDESPYNQASGNVSFHFDGANLDFGMGVNLGSRLRTNLFAGVSFAHIKQNLVSRFSNPSDDVSRSIRNPTSFLGAGPRFGLDLHYQIVAGFHFTGKATAGLLVGRQKNHTTFKSYSPDLAGLGIAPPNTQHTTLSNTTRVVPALEGSLGLSYVWAFCDHYMLKIEGGYQAQTYLNALASIDMGSQVIDLSVLESSTGVYARTFEQNISNFSLAGPYAMLMFGF